MGLAPRGHLGEEASWGLRAVVGFPRVKGQVDRAVIPKRAGARETERKGLLCRTAGPNTSSVVGLEGGDVGPQGGRDPLSAQPLGLVGPCS